MKLNIRNEVALLCSLLCLCSLFLCACTSDEELLVYKEVQEEAIEDVQPASESKELNHGTQMEAETVIQSQSESVAQSQSEPVVPATVYIHVCGAVNQAGVYALPTGVRLFEAVEAAGGFTEEADADYVNQAEILLDGMKVQIPTKEQTKEWEAAGNGSAEGSVFTIGENATEQSISQSEPVKQENGMAISDGKVNINVADEATLCTINGIGQGRAKSIIAYREKHGQYSTIEEIMNVDGIKNATFEKIKDQICVK